MNVRMCQHQHVCLLSRCVRVTLRWRRRYNNKLTLTDESSLLDPIVRANKGFDSTNNASPSPRKRSKTSSSATTTNSDFSSALYLPQQHRLSGRSAAHATGRDREFAWIITMQVALQKHSTCCPVWKHFILLDITAHLEEVHHVPPE